MRIVHSFIRASTSKRVKKIVEDESKNEVVSFNENEDKDGDTFEQSWMCWIAEHLSQIARLASLVYACDCLVSMMQVTVLKMYYVDLMSIF